MSQIPSLRCVLVISTLAALTAAPACDDGGGGPGNSTNTSTSGEDDAHAKRAAGQAGAGHSLVHAKALTEAFVQEDPTIDPTKTAGENADAIAAQIQSVATDTTCKGVKITHDKGSANLSAEFPAGCTLNGIPISGTVAVVVTVDSSKTFKVEFTLTKVSVNGHTLDGKVAEMTSNGTSYTTEVTGLVADGKTYDYKGTQTLDKDLKGAKLDGTGTAKDPNEKYPTVYTITGLHQAFGACYADAGTIAQTLTTEGATAKITIKTTATVAFDANTAKDGTVDITVKVGAAPAATKKDVKLPSYGSCPKP